jgi:hypothetical protein
VNRAQKRKLKKLSKPKAFKWEDPKSNIIDAIRFEALDVNQASITVANAFNETVKRLALFNCTH